MQPTGKNKYGRLFGQALFVIALLGLGFLIGFFVYGGRGDPKNLSIRKHGAALSKESLVNPLLECADIENISNQMAKQIKIELEGYIKREKNVGKISTAAVYFRDLNNGPWVGINEKKEFSPGSLLKVPFMMSIFKMAEQDPSLLAKSLVYDGESENIEQNYPPPLKLEKGQTYSVNDLVERMVAYSDNDAILALTQTIDMGAVRDTYTELGIDPPTRDDYSIPVKTYASFFRILFNSTYLSISMSERALQVLSKSAWTLGLRAGVPDNIIVVHKFGERFEVDKSNEQLHDCGIVYYPGLPYVLCVMVQGPEFDAMANFIKGVSELVYNSVNQGKPSTMLLEN